MFYVESWITISVRIIIMTSIHPALCEWKCADKRPSSSFSADCASHYIRIISVSTGSGLCDNRRTCADTGGASDYVKITCNNQNRCLIFLTNPVTASKRPDCLPGNGPFHMFITYSCGDQVIPTPAPTTKTNSRTTSTTTPTSVSTASTSSSTSSHTTQSSLSSSTSSSSSSSESSPISLLPVTSGTSTSGAVGTDTRVPNGDRDEQQGDQKDSKVLEIALPVVLLLIVAVVIITIVICVLRKRNSAARAGLPDTEDKPNSKKSDKPLTHGNPTYEECDVINMNVSPGNKIATLEHAKEGETDNTVRNDHHTGVPSVDHNRRPPVEYSEVEPVNNKVFNLPGEDSGPYSAAQAIRPVMYENSDVQEGKLGDMYSVVNKPSTDPDDVELHENTMYSGLYN